MRRVAELTQPERIILFGPAGRNFQGMRWYVMRWFAT